MVVRLVPLARGDNTSYVAGNTGLFSSYLEPLNPPCRIRVYVVFDTGGGTFNFMRAKNINGSQAVAEGTNAAIAPQTLDANSGYTFDFPVDKGDWFNFQYSTTAKPLTLRVWEIDAEA